MRPRLLDASRVRLGTYGRVGWLTDPARGSQARSLNVVTHGPRLEEPPYVELDLGYLLGQADARSFLVAVTLAFGEDLFHYDGRFAAQVALRNLYAEARGLLLAGLGLWVGSRTYRGDDVYLLDFWPLDELNTLGGGASYRIGRYELAAHVGVNRLDDEFQLQQITIPGATFGTEEVLVLDRQRTIVSLKARREVLWPSRQLQLALAVYGELHHLPPGVLQRDLAREKLPADLGWLVGAQVGLSGTGTGSDGPVSFANLWFRTAGGLAAYDALAVPFGLDADKRAVAAREALVAASANLERGRLGLMFGGYLRYFNDADGNDSDPDDAWEIAVALRPHLFLGRHLQQVAEVSLQARRPDGLDPRSQTHLVPLVAKLSLMPTLSWRRGTYARPQLRVIYTLSWLDADARARYPEQDPRHGVALHHFVGAQVEWWHNSSYR